MATRIRSLDATRGVIMMVMALDHFVYFINRFHPAEFWVLAPPVFPSPAYEVFRFMSHLCAPGFLLLAGVGLVLAAEQRRVSGWDQGRITRSFVLRGMVLLVVVQLVLEPLAWGLGELGGRGVPLNTVRYPGAAEGGPFGYLGVIYAIAVCLALGSALRWLPKLALGLLAAASLAASPLVVSRVTTPTAPIAPLLNVLFVPGNSFFFTNYPLFPWLGVFLLGMLLGRIIVDRGEGVVSRVWIAGTALTVAGVAIRFVHPWGEYSPYRTGEPWSFFELTKYPASPAYLAITVGIVLVLISILDCIAKSGLAGQGRALRLVTAALETFGREPLFFYLLHLFCYGALSLILVLGDAPAATLAGWACSLLLFAPLLRAFHRARPKLPPWLPLVVTRASTHGS